MASLRIVLFVQQVMWGLDYWQSGPTPEQMQLTERCELWPMSKMRSVFDG